MPPSSIIRRLRKVNSELGSARSAPYPTRAKPKGSKEGRQLYLVVEAEITYYYRSRKEVSLPEGKSIKEKLTGIRLRRPSEAEKK